MSFNYLSISDLCNWSYLHVFIAKYIHNINKNTEYTTLTYCRLLLIQLFYKHPNETVNISRKHESTAGNKRNWEGMVKCAGNNNGTGNLSSDAPPQSSTHMVKANQRQKYCTNGTALNYMIVPNT